MKWKHAHQSILAVNYYRFSLLRDCLIKFKDSRLKSRQMQTKAIQFHSFQVQKSYFQGKWKTNYLFSRLIALKHEKIGHHHYNTWKSIRNRNKVERNFNEKRVNSFLNKWFTLKRSQEIVFVYL